MPVHDSRHIFPLFNSCWTHLSDTGSTEIINGGLSRVTLLTEVFKVQFKLKICGDFLILVFTNIFRTQFVFTKRHAVIRRDESCIELAAEHQVGGESLVIELKLDVSK
jgi:hypothetical protein